MRIKMKLCVHIVIGATIIDDNHTHLQLLVDCMHTLFTPFTYLVHATLSLFEP
jgi:hypothetical protein